MPLDKKLLNNVDDQKTVAFAMKWCTPQHAAETVDQRIDAQGALGMNISFRIPLDDKSSN